MILTIGAISETDRRSLADVVREAAAQRLPIVIHVGGGSFDASDAATLVLQMRRIGIERFLFGSDYNVLTPAEAVSFVERLGLTEKEQELLRHNCAPWVCPGAAQAFGTE